MSPVWGLTGKAHVCGHDVHPHFGQYLGVQGMGTGLRGEHPGGWSSVSGAPASTWSGLQSHCGFVCISPGAGDVRHLSMCLFAARVSSVVKCLFRLRFS